VEMLEHAWEIMPAYVGIEKRVGTILGYNTAFARAEHLRHALRSPCSIGSVIVCEASRFLQTERLSFAANLGGSEEASLN